MVLTADFLGDSRQLQVTRLRRFFGGNVVKVVSVTLTFGDFCDISADGSAKDAANERVDV